MSPSIDEQIVLVTGALGRLGTAFSKSIVASGGNVFLVDIDEEKGEQLLIELGNKKAFFYQADTSMAGGIEQSIQACVAQFGKVDTVVHAAYPRSAGWGATLENLKPEHLFEDLNKQLGGAIILSQQVLHYFQQQGGGHLIHISSIQGIAAPKFEHYEGTR